MAKSIDIIFRKHHNLYFRDRYWWDHCGGRQYFKVWDAGGFDKSIPQVEELGVKDLARLWRLGCVKGFDKKYQEDLAY